MRTPKSRSRSSSVRSGGTPVRVANSGLEVWLYDDANRRSGNVWDNSVIESFLSTLKIERVARKSYTTRDAARADIFDHIERFYNPIMRHFHSGQPESRRIRTRSESGLA